MKELSQLANNLKNYQQQSASSSESSRNTDSKAADWVWVKMSEIYGEQWIRENGEEPSLMWIAALNKQPIESIKNGIARTVKQNIVWPPNLPKFIELCGGCDDAATTFARFIERKPPQDHAEYLTRGKVGFACRTQLDEAKALKLWTETLKNFRARIASGEITVPDESTAKIETPEKMKETLTPEQRNQQLDRQIDEMLAKGQRLIGPFKARYDERNN